MTKRELYIKALEKSNFRSAPIRSGKYLAYTKDKFEYKSGKQCYVFLGPRGAFRLGPVATKSYDAPKFAEMILRRFSEGDS